MTDTVLLNEVKMMRAEARAYYISLMSLGVMLRNPELPAADVAKGMEVQLAAVNKVARETVYGVGS